MKNFWIEGANVHLGMRAGTELLTAIDRAKESILVCSPYISADLLTPLYPKISDGFQLRVITAPIPKWQKDRGLAVALYNSLYENSALHVVKYFDVENKNSDCHNWLHSKFFIIDNTQLFLGSVNFTLYGLNKNHEVVINTNDLCAITQFTKEFEWLWDNELAQYENPIC